MFLEYAVKGIWMPLTSVIMVTSMADGGLGFSEQQKGMIIGLPLAIGSMLAPFLAGQLTDKMFNTERVLGTMLIVGGFAIYCNSFLTSFMAWLMVSIVFSIMYVPTISLTNSLAMSHLPDAKVQFPRVRVWGTLGWIAVSWLFPMIWLQSDHILQAMPPFLVGEERPDAMPRMYDSFKAAGVMAVAFGLFSWFALPKTPPKNKGAVAEGKSKFAFVEALSLFKHKSFAVLMAISLPVSILHTIYMMNTSTFLQQAGLERSLIMPAMSIGQFSEIIALVCLGKFLTKFGFRNVMTFGISIYALRYGIYGIPNLPIEVIVGTQVLHGLCFACFYAGAFIYVERISPKKIHHTAQTLFFFVMMGLAPLLTGTFINGMLAWIAGAPVVDGSRVLDLDSYVVYWRIVAVAGLIAAVTFWALFRDETKDESDEPEDKPAA